MMTAADSARALQEKFPADVVEVVEFRGEWTAVVSLNSLVPVLTWLRDEAAYDLLLDISSLDHDSDRDPRFEVVYGLYSLTSRTHLRVRAAVPEPPGEVPTVTHLWPTANWHEREIYDMMGLKFTGHPDLRRILMWDGYPYFPLRKEFPLAGRPTEVPEVAFTGVAPLAGGPFVTSPGAASRVDAEPRARGQS